MAASQPAGEEDAHRRAMIGTLLFFLGGRLLWPPAGHTTAAAGGGRAAVGGRWFATGDDVAPLLSPVVVVVGGGGRGKTGLEHRRADFPLPACCRIIHSCAAQFVPRAGGSGVRERLPPGKRPVSGGRLGPRPLWPSRSFDPFWHPASFGHSPQLPFPPTMALLINAVKVSGCLPPRLALSGRALSSPSVPGDPLRDHHGHEEGRLQRLHLVRSLPALSPIESSQPRPRLRAVPG